MENKAAVMEGTVLTRTVEDMRSELISLYSQKTEAVNKIKELGRLRYRTQGKLGHKKDEKNEGEISGKRLHAESGQNVAEERKDNKVKKLSSVAIRDTAAPRIMSVASRPSKNVSKKEEKTEAKPEESAKETPKDESSPQKSKQHDSKMTDVDVKRNKRLFSNLLGHLKKAKTRLEEEKPHLDQQSQLQEKVTAELQSNSQNLMEKQLEEYEKRREEQIKTKRELDRKIFKLNEEISVQPKAQELYTHKVLFEIENTFATTQNREKPHIYWQPGIYNTKTEKLKEETVKELEAHLEEYKEKSGKELEEQIKKYEERIKQHEKAGEEEAVGEEEESEAEENKEE